MSMVAADLSAPSPALPAIDCYRPGDDAAIVACLRSTFDEPARLERWRHLNLGNPVGRSVIVLARHDDAIVGQIANLRRRLRFFGAEHEVAHTLDTVVHPTWQHRGLFPALVEASGRELERQGLHVTYGVANEHAKHVAERYEHRRPLGAFPVLVRPIRPLASLVALVRNHFRQSAAPDAGITECAAAGPVAAPAGRSILDAGADAWTSPRFDARHTALFADHASLPPIAFVRDAASLAWRYPDRPDLPYAQCDVVRDAGLAATAIVRVIETAGLRLVLLMEWHWRRDHADAARALARDVLALARRLDAHGVAAMGTRGSPQRRILTRLGFIALPARAFPQHAWPGVHARPPHATDERWTNGDNWYFTWGDGLTL
jgi:hypothetical protein